MTSVTHMTRMTRMQVLQYPVTPDGRYFVVRGRLWRCTDPAIPEAERERLVRALMAARRAMGSARRAADAAGSVDARAAVDAAKRALGERGPVWWNDGAPNFNRYLAKNTPYAAWFSALGARPTTPARAGTRRTRP